MNSEGMYDYEAEDEWDEGYDAFLNGLEITSNPYDPGDLIDNSPFDAWVDGWRYAKNPNMTGDKNET